MSNAIQEFVSSMSKARGFARTSKYAVIITPPAKLLALSVGGVDAEQGFGIGVSTVAQQVNLHCNSISMPGHDMQAQDVQHGSAPGRQMVQSHDYAGTIAASFYLDSHMRERLFFEKWQKMVVNKSTHKAYYYDDYIGTLEIFQLDGNGEITYGIKATEVYPSTLGGIEYAYGNTNAIALQSVGFEFRQWFNMTNDAIEGYSQSIFVADKDRQEKVDNYRSNQAKLLQIDTSIGKIGASLAKFKHLKKPEVDVDRHAANRKSEKRDEHLAPPTAKR